jgi:acyl-CoA thioester hydrolase
VSFPFHHVVDVRFRDLDVLGHAHHSLPLIYAEEARAAFWREVTGRRGLDGIDYVLAEVQVRFHEPIFFPARLDVGLRVSHVSAKSFVMEFEVRGEDARLYSSGRTVQVMYDYATRTSKPVPPELRARLEAFSSVTAPAP